MMFKKRWTSSLCLFLLPFALYSGNKIKKEERLKNKMENLLNTLPDSLYERVKREDLLQDEVYVKLARDGWNNQEIVRIMDNYLQYRKSKVKGSHAYGMYAKQWLPTFGYTPGGDSIYQYVDTTYSAEEVASARQLFSATLDRYYPQIPYTPDDRLSKKRNTGYFRPVLQYPNSGRIHWIVIDPKNEDHLMVVPDGAGIFRTSDLGKTWDCVTDRIPDREFRKICYHSAVPVDPDDWNHFFAFMKNGSETRVYETTDGGQSWTRIEGATHKGFKRGYGFKDAKGNFKFIGAVQQPNYMQNKLWISNDKGVHWDEITLPDALKETHPENGTKGAFFQNFAFHPTNRDLIYMPTSRSIYYFDDGAEPTEVNGKNTYNVKRMVFDVLSQDGQTVRAKAVSEFPYKGTTQGFLEIDPAHPDTMWFATSSRNVSYGVNSAVYKTTNGGKTWITLQEPLAGIGSGHAFGNESPWGWLGGFGVNFKNPQYVYGCSMSSAISSDGGMNFKEYAWGNRLKADYNGGFYYTTSARHNADNHCIVSHPSGRVFRASDAGLLMIDEDINGHQWTSINGAMGNQLHYSIKVNEFGDQVMLGNTQDVDVQTYKYGRWENWRGYEGTEAFINPYGGTCYFSGGGGGGLDVIELSSWKEGYSKADVCTGYWYLIHDQTNASFFRVEDFGRTPIDITQNTKDDSNKGAGANDFALSRKPDGTSVLYVYNKNNTIVRSEDNGNTFTTVKVKTTNGTVNAQYSNSRIAADPNDADIVYLGQKGGKVIKINVRTNEVEDLSAGLPNTGCKELIFHEGSGDLYYCGDVGIYLREHGTNTWVLWMDGYNPLEYKRVTLNYTTQEMVIGDYGRGVWVADLENPSDRYFDDGFPLKMISEVNGRMTVGIDTKWTIPMYYEYSWTVNGKEQMNPYQYLTTELKPGDKVQLKLTLRESPDVTTTSAELTIPETKRQKEVVRPDVLPVAGKALYSDGNGRIDLGYVDYFYNDFTVDFWINPESDGVILANRPVDTEKDTRGWALLIENGQLKFRYAPGHLVNQPSYETGFTQQQDVVVGVIEMGKWSHVALTHDRDGAVCLYLNGTNPPAQTSRILYNHTLNAAVYLSLFADGYERRAIKGAVDELRIWKSALTADDVRRTMFSQDITRPSDLVFYQNFNQGELNLERELFSQQGMQVRTRAVTRYIDMPVGVAASWSAIQNAAAELTMTSGDKTLMTIRMDQPDRIGQVAVYEQNLQGAKTIPNIDEQYFEVVSDIYQVRAFDVSDENVQLDLFFPLTLDENQRYALYVSDAYDQSVPWNRIGLLEKDAASGKYVVKGLNLSDLQNRKLVVLRNKPAVEVSIRDVGLTNTLVIYDRYETIYHLDAQAIAGLNEPAGTYEIRSENGYLNIRKQFNFINHKAEAEISVDMRKVGNQKVVEDRLIGQDGRMIPLTVKILNQTLPEEAGQAAVFSKGGMILNNPSLVQALNNSNTMTLMGWVRIDDSTFLEGVKPLIFSRSTSPNVCGLHVANGNLRLHWNDTWYGWSSGLTLTKEDVGRWVHVALAVAPNYISVYLNGQEHRHNTTVPKSKVKSLWMLGVDSQTDQRFSGAFDQVAFWDKTLSTDEIRKYMYHAPKLNEEHLLAYVDMDYLNEDGAVMDHVSELPMSYTGTMRLEKDLGILYAPIKEMVQEASATENGQTFYLETPASNKRRCTFAVFNGLPYNSASTERPELYPLLSRYAALTFDNLPGFKATETLRLTVNLPDAISASDHITLALRPFGRQTEYSSFIAASTVADGKAVFQIPGNLINGSVDFMLMTDAEILNKPVKVDMNVLNWNEKVSIQNGDLYVLPAGVNEFVVQTKVRTHNSSSSVFLTSVEKAYVNVQDTLDLTKTDQKFRVRIDTTYLDRFAENPVTLRLLGVTENTDIQFRVVMEPKVRLTLVQNQEVLNDEGQIVVDTINKEYHVKVDLLQGILPDGLPFEIKYDTVSNLKITMGTQAGSLLSNHAVVIKDNLEYYKSATGTEEDEGWNLVANPYLHNLNLTKPQNVEVDESYVLKYMYEYDPETDTYFAWDMVENYDPNQKIKPMQPFFIQTRQAGASLKITPEAKSQELNRKVFDHYMLHDAVILKLGLLKAEGDLCDRTEVRVHRESSDDFVFGEDAVKMWGGLNAHSNEMATQASGRHLSVNVLGSRSVEVPVYLKLSDTGTFEFSLLQQNGIVFDDLVYLYDKKLKVRHDLKSGQNYRFDVATPQEATTRFALMMSLGATTGVEWGTEEGNSITVNEDGMCTIEGLDGKSVIEIFDTVGRRIVYLPTAQSTVSLRLNEGIYLVRVRTGHKDYSRKIAVK